VQHQASYSLEVEQALSDLAPAATMPLVLELLLVMVLALVLVLAREWARPLLARTEEQQQLELERQLALEAVAHNIQAASWELAPVVPRLVPLSAAG